MAWQQLLHPAAQAAGSLLDKVRAIVSPR